MVFCLYVLPFGVIILFLHKQRQFIIRAAHKRRRTTYTNLSINTLYKTAIITFDLCIKIIHVINATYIIPKYIHQYKTIEYKILTHHTLSYILGEKY